MLGRLPDLLKRFDTITLGSVGEARDQAGWLLDHGDRRVSQTLYYFVAWELLAEREKKWAAFGGDPEWHKARAETEKNGAIVAT